jgi:hypothetical protein
LDILITIEQHFRAIGNLSEIFCRIRTSVVRRMTFPHGGTPPRNCMAEARRSYLSDAEKTRIVTDLPLATDDHDSAEGEALRRMDRTLGCVTLDRPEAVRRLVKLGLKAKTK